VPTFPPSRYSDHELPGVVADVCRDLDLRDPRSVSQARFDAGRADAGHPQAPSAKQISARLRLPWPEVKQLAFDPKRSVDRTVGQRVGKDDESWVTDEVCIFALLTVASRIGVDTDLTPDSYKVEIERMLTADRRRYLHGGRLVMPTVGQIERRLGRWPEALIEAGLKPSEVKRFVATSGIDAIELCLEATGCLPSLTTLVKFFELNKLALSGRIGRRYPLQLEELRARRAAAGKWTPPGYTSPRERPDLLCIIPGLEGPKRLPGAFDEDRVLAAMVQFVRDRRGIPQTRRDYLNWAAKRHGAPAASSMSSGGRPGFAAYRTQARLIVREEENGQW
jgi:hypothetical protein